MNLKRINKGSSQLLTKEDGTTILISYSTAVAAFLPGVGFFKTDKHHSTTTSKHVNQWLKSEGLNPKEVPTLTQQALNLLC